MKVALFSYSKSRNIGDDIQTLAVAQHIGEPYGFIDRDFINTYDGNKIVVVMNGWFNCGQVPSPKITPIFFGFHMTSTSIGAYSLHREYFKKHEPIGCRDRGTVDILKNWGVEAYFTGCATMTFPTRPASSNHHSEAGRVFDKTYIVDVQRRHFGLLEQRKYVFRGQYLKKHLKTAPNKHLIAQSLLDEYKRYAKNVVTSRIHCAMPCFAMGIPVIYVGKREYRTELLDELRLPSKQVNLRERIRLNDLEFKAPDFDDLKTKIANDLRGKLSDAGIELADWSPRED